MRQDLTGRKFGKLELIKKLPKAINASGKTIATYLCACDCGGSIIKKSEQLKRGFSLHCGCMPSQKGKIKNGKRKL